MRFAMKDSKSDMSAPLEAQLRRTADAARQTPSPALRRRTLAILHESQFVDRAARRGRLGWAVCACSVLMALIALFAMMQRNGAPREKEMVQAPQNNHTNPRTNRPIDFTSIAGISRPGQPIVQLDLSAPYKREAQLIARDAGRAWDRFRQQLPRLRPLEIPAAPPSKDYAMPAPASGA